MTILPFPSLTCRIPSLHTHTHMPSPAQPSKGRDKITLYSTFEMAHKRLLKIQNKQNDLFNLEKRSGRRRYRMYEVNI